MVTRSTSRGLLALGLCAAAGCAGDLRLGAADGGASDAPGDGAPTARVQTRRDGDARVTTVDASRSDAWVYLDLDQGELGAESMAGWDLAFQRFNIKTNGGVSGTAGVEVVAVTGVRFEDLREAPAAGWVRDEADGPDKNPDPDLAFGRGDGWYSYNPMSHTLAPRDVVFVVRTSEGRAVKLRMTGYYDPAGTGGYPAFRWAALGGTP